MVIGATLPCRVYPRVGGGTVSGYGNCQHQTGLSPRGRGNRLASQVRALFIRSIPAWAGEPGRGFGGGDFGRVYPRVGGGTNGVAAVATDQYGLSPRGRGNHPVDFPSNGYDGSIPAWAGEPDTPGSGLTLRWVYPRVGGGTIIALHACFSHSGLSPRGRGNLRLLVAMCYNLRSIPAWAGEPTMLLPSL